MKKVILYTDGSCFSNPGPGGWACVLIYNEVEKHLSGGKKETTNNEMEITAVLNGLKALKEPCYVDVYSDSAYVVNTFDKHWIDGWIKNGWKNSAKKEVKNKELFQEVYELMQVHKVKFHKVAGLKDDKYNNLCDELARKESAKF